MAGFTGVCTLWNSAVAKRVRNWNEPAHADCGEISDWSTAGTIHELRLRLGHECLNSHVDKLTQSLLARAFRGHLVSQDPTDEPAENYWSASASGM
jgi:hypothetical protein